MPCKDKLFSASLSHMLAFLLPFMLDSEWETRLTFMFQIFITGCKSRHKCLIQNLKMHTGHHTKNTHQLSVIQQSEKYFVQLHQSYFLFFLKSTPIKYAHFPKILHYCSSHLNSAQSPFDTGNDRTKNYQSGGDPQ
jgi:hypothetical protein